MFKFILLSVLSIVPAYSVAAEEGTFKSIELKLTQATTPGFVAVNVTRIGEAAEVKIVSTCDSVAFSRSIDLNKADTKKLFGQLPSREELWTVEPTASGISEQRTVFTPKLRVAVVTSDDLKLERLIDRTPNEESGEQVWGQFLRNSLLTKLVRDLPRTACGHFTRLFIEDLENRWPSEQSDSGEPG